MFGFGYKNRLADFDQWDGLIQVLEYQKTGRGRGERFPYPVGRIPGISVQEFMILVFYPRIFAQWKQLWRRATRTIGEFFRRENGGQAQNLHQQPVIKSDENYKNKKRAKTWQLLVQEEHHQIHGVPAKESCAQKSMRRDTGVDRLCVENLAKESYITMLQRHQRCNAYATQQSVSSELPQSAKHNASQICNTTHTPRYV